MNGQRKSRNYISKMLFAHKSDKILSHYGATKIYWENIMLSEINQKQKKTVIIS